MIPAQNPASADRSWRPITAAVLLLAATVCAVLLGPQLAVWPSGFSLSCLAAATLLLLPLPGTRPATALPRPVVISGLVLVIWLVGRAATSPVAEFAVADVALLTACLGGFIVTRRLLEARGAVELLFYGFGVLLLSNGLPMLAQSRDPSFVAILPRGTEVFPSGFFAYYGDCAAFLLGISLLAGGLAWDPCRTKTFRLFMTLVALAGAAGVIFTRSRGGIAGLGAGAVILVFVAPWLTAGKGSSRIPAFVLAVPVLVIGAIILLGGGMDDAQKARGIDDTTTSLLDNSARLLWIRIALSCIATHPFQGGGSRSFSWENFQFWDAQEAGYSPAKPEFVHNELIQLTSDYGLIGLLLMLVFLGSALVCAILGRWHNPAAKARTAVFLGGLAALTGLLVHGCFHFVFHLPPAALLLGVTFAMLLDPARRETPVRGRAAGFAAVLAMLPVAAFATFVGIRSLPVFLELAPVKYRFTREVPGLSETLTRLQAAAGHWPTGQLHMERGQLLQASAAAASGAEGPMRLEAAAEAFRESLALHPFHPEASVNRANVLGMLGRDAEAEQEYLRAIRLQGGMEIGFKARYSSSLHHFRKAERLRVGGKTDEALTSLLLARDLYDSALYSPKSNEFGEAGRAYRVALSQHLGTWLQALGRFEDAADEYDRATRMPHTWVLHFLAAANLTAWGDALWLDHQPERALRKFTDARARLAKCGGLVPPGFSASDLQELGRKLDSKVAFLEGAGIRLEEDGGSGGR